jgi:hypothetical protein
MMQSTLTETADKFIPTQSTCSAAEAASTTELHAIITILKSINSPFGDKHTGMFKYFQKSNNEVRIHIQVCSIYKTYQTR